MPIPPEFIAAAEGVQLLAAHDQGTSLRLIAGPGTGKSTSIKHRVYWLLQNGQRPDRIYAVSFTRASSRDLEDSIKIFCRSGGFRDFAKVSTLHSLALTILKRANLLTRYPASPLILDEWEMENIFDAEFGQSFSEPDKRRREDIRRFHEAYWSTDVTAHSNYLPPNPPISAAEQAAFNAFHLSRSVLYSCVLPGEIVRQCVLEIRTGTIEPASLLRIEHLIVDEFQDLNPMDQELVDGIIAGGASVFIAGDDDQSIYSFRYANPAGIQNFATLYPATVSHTLNECFRCMPEIMGAANALLASFPAPQRLEKNMQALFRHSIPPASGTVHRWRFSDGRQEARAIAESCRDLIAQDLPAGTILILLSNKRALLSDLEDAFAAAGVPFDPLDQECFHETSSGRFVYALLRIVSNRDDYIAHRTILGVRSGVGVKTAHRIAEEVILNNLNYKNIFYNALPNGVFSGQRLTAINATRTILAQVSQWTETDNLGHRLADIRNLIEANFDDENVAKWDEFIATIPVAATLKEVLAYITAETDEQRFLTLVEIYDRLGEAAPLAQMYEPRVKIMTMHGAKGLGARVVFIPGLEEDVLPGPHRSPYQGMVLEAARLLYVSITRARAACILSFAGRRLVHGRGQPQQASRFNAHLGGPFVPRQAGLNQTEIEAIKQDCAQL